MDELVLLALFAVPVGLGVLGAIPLRRAWLRGPEDGAALARGAAKLLALAVGIDVAVTLAPLPELLTYQVYAGGAMHSPALARFFALFAALASLGCVLPLAVAFVRRGGRSRRLAAAAFFAALAPLPLHLVEVWLVGRIFGLHFFWR